MLQPACDRHRPAERDIKLGKLPRGVSRGGVDRSPRLGDHDLRQLELRMLLDEIGGKTIGFARSCPVADGQKLDLVLLRKPGQKSNRIVPAALRFVRVDRRGGDHLAGRVNDCDLYSRAEARVETHCGACTGWRRKQQVAEIAGEYFDRFLFGGLPQPQAEICVYVEEEFPPPFPLDRIEQPAIAGPAAITDVDVVGNAALEDARRARLIATGLLGNEVYVEHLLLGPAEERENAVRG